MKRLCSHGGWMLCALALVCVGCKDAPGRPKAQVERPSEVLSFPVLYQQNCAGCHGSSGRGGVAISLGNPAYLAMADPKEIARITTEGIPGTLMPPFARSHGGMLTDQQVGVIVQGMERAWGHGNSVDGQTPPSYAATSAGNAAQGQKEFQTYCARCHGADGTGVERAASNAGTMAKTGSIPIPGSIVDPAYLALISNQGLRTLIIAGHPNQGMPDWTSDMAGTGACAMTEQEVTDIAAWLESHRIATPGQPYGPSTSPASATSTTSPASTARRQDRHE